MRDGLHQGGMSGGIFCTGENLPSDTGKRNYKSIIPHSRSCALSVRDRTSVVLRCSLAVTIARTFCSSSLLILPYGLPAPTVFAPDVFLPDAGVVLPPPPVTILPARRQSASLRSTHKLPNFSDQQHIQMSPQIRIARGYTHAQNRACSARLSPAPLRVWLRAICAAPQPTR